MLLGIKTCSLVRLLSLVWLMVWLVTFPLVHVHPEADHAHGAPEHVHGGLYHSVLSKDFSCEFHRHQHQQPGTSHEYQTSNPKIVGSAQHTLNHAEFDFSLASTSLRDQTSNPPQAVCLPTVLEDEACLLFFSFKARNTGVPPPLRTLPPDLWSRPPPRTSI